MENSNMTAKKERKDRTVLFACLGAVAAGMILAVLTFLVMFSIDLAGGVEDTNGEFDTSLTNVIEEKVLVGENSYSATMLQTGKVGGHTNVDGRLDEYDSDYCTMSARKISGVLTIQATNVDSHELTPEIDSTLQSDNLEIFIIVDGEVVQKAAVNRSSIITLTDIAGKDVVVKIGAESAQMEISVRRDY